MVKTSYIVAGIIVLIIIIAAAYIAITSLAPAPSPTPPPSTTPTTPPPGKITFRWGTSRVGSSGYRALVKLVEVLNKEMPDYEFSAYPTAGAVASTKAYARGELEGCYTADVSFRELYEFRDRFEGFEAKRMPVQTFWAYTIEVTIAIHDSKIDVYKKWSDLNGKKVFTFPLGWDVGAVLRSALKALNIEWEHVELDLGMVGASLERGEIEATGVYTTSHKSPAPWIKEMEMTTDIAILNPSPDEIEKLKAAGFQIVEIDPKQAYATDVNVEKIYAVPFYYGFHMGTEVPEDVVYRMLKILEAHAQELAEYDPGFELLAKDFAGFQVKGIESIPEIPVHPGLAKFLKEKGLWQDEWKIAS